MGIRDRPISPGSPWQNPYVERLIGTVRRECLDHALFWTATDLELKLSAFKNYYNRYRIHASLKGHSNRNHGIQGRRFEIASLAEALSGDVSNANRGLKRKPPGTRSKLYDSVIIRPHDSTS
jgi:hypothetical protein